MIDHTGHPHPSTPAARALCRKNGGTGFIGKIGGHVPVAEKKNNDKPAPRVKPKGVDVTPDKPKTPNPPVQKKPTVPKNHGEPKPPTAKPVGKAPKKPATPLPTPDQKKVPVEKFDHTSMQMRGNDGTWKDVATVETGQSPRGRTRVFKDINGNLIAAVPVTDTVDARPKPGIEGHKTPTAHIMGGYIPPATSKDGNLEQIKIQNALRRGASRDFILSRTNMPVSTANREIDRILQKYEVPNHVYPRVGSGAPPPKIADVKPKQAPKAPSVPDADPVVTIGLTKVRDSINVDPRVHDTVHKVLDVQATHIGGKVARIKAIDSKLPEVSSPEGQRMGLQAGTLAVCKRDGHIHLHKDMHDKNFLVSNATFTGWFSQGGNGIEQVIAHEMGHAFLDETKMTPDQRKRIADVLFNGFGMTNPFGTQPPTWYQGLLDRVIAHPDNKKKVKRLVSKYGSTNIEELMAEVWSEYTMNPKPRPKLKKLGDVLKGIIAEGIG